MRKIYALLLTLLLKAFRAKPSADPIMLDIQRTVYLTMAKVEDVAADLATIKAELGEVAVKLDAQTAMIADLQAQLEAGTPVSQEQLDALAAQAAEIKDMVTPLA